MLNLLDSGSGPALLCLHGIGGSSQSFQAQLAGLAPRRRVIAWDAPGYAGSPDPDEYPGPGGYTSAIAEILDRAGAQRAVVLGMSWGGVLAAQFALDYPHRVRALVLGDSTRGSGQSPEQAAAMRGRPDELVEVGVDEFAARRAQRLVASPALVAPAAEAMARAIRLPGYRYAAEFMASTDHGPRLAEISAPTLVVYGERDLVTGRAESEAIAALIPNAWLAVIPGAGHLANQEAPELFNAEVESFLRTIGDDDGH